MTRIEVSRTVLRWALERSRREPAALRQKLPKLRQWLDGQSQPTLRQLEKFARETRTPLGYLFLGEPPEETLPIPHFRTLDDGHPHRPSPDLLDTVYTMQRRQAWMREYLVNEGEEPLQFVGSVKLRHEPPSVAEKIRGVLGIEQGWAANQATWTGALDELRTRIEAVRILVAVNGIVGNNTHRKLDPEEFRGFVLVDEFAPLVFVNGSDAKAAQMFTLAHELAHVWLGSSAAFDLRELQPANDETERACNRIAAEFLVPERELRQLWASVHNDPERFQAVARRFKVSELVAARRAEDLGLVGRPQFHEFYRRYLQEERRRASKRPSGGDFYASQNLRIGRRFGEMVARAAKEGNLLYRDAYQLTGLSGSTFDRYAELLEEG